MARKIPANGRHANGAQGCFDLVRRWVSIFLTSIGFRFIDDFTAECLIVPELPHDHQSIAIQKYTERKSQHEDDQLSLSLVPATHAFHAVVVPVFDSSSGGIDISLGRIQKSKKRALNAGVRNVFETGGQVRKCSSACGVWRSQHIEQSEREIS